MTNELERMWKCAWPNLRYCPYIYLERQRTNTENYQNISFLWIRVKPFAKLSVFLEDINIGVVTSHGRAGGKVKVKVRVFLNCHKHFAFFTSLLEWGEWWASRSGPFKSSEKSRDVHWRGLHSGGNGLFSLPGVERRPLCLKSVR